MVLLPFHGTVLSLCLWPSSNPRFFHLTLSPWGLCSNFNIYIFLSIHTGLYFYILKFARNEVRKIWMYEALIQQNMPKFPSLFPSVPMEGLQELWGTFSISAGWPKCFFHAVVTFPCSVRRLGQQWGVFPGLFPSRMGCELCCSAQWLQNWSNSLRLL